MPISGLPNRQALLRKALYIFTPATNLHSRASLPGIDDRASPDLQSSLWGLFWASEATAGNAKGLFIGQPERQRVPHKPFAEITKSDTGNVYCHDDGILNFASYFSVRLWYITYMYFPRSEKNKGNKVLKDAKYSRTLTRRSTIGHARIVLWGHLRVVL